MNTYCLEDARTLGRIYMLAFPLQDPGDLEAYLRQGPGRFLPGHGAVGLAADLGQRLMEQGLRSFKPGDRDSTYERVLAMGGTAEWARDIADSVNQGATDLFMMGQELVWLSQVLPSAAAGNWQPFLTTGTPVRQQIRQVLPIVKELADPGVLGAAMQMAEPYAEQQIVALAVMCGLCHQTS